MDNHFHAIVAAPELAKTLADLKKFTAREIVAQLQSEGRQWLLDQLRYFRVAHKQASTWQESSHPQPIASDGMMEQKLEYLHNNPVKRGLVVSPEHWRYSSAHEWLAGAAPVMRCDRFGDSRSNETEFLNQVRSQTEFGNEGTCCIGAPACDRVTEAGLLA